MEEILLRLAIMYWIVLSWIILDPSYFDVTDDLNEISKKIDQLEEEIKSKDSDCRS